MKLNYKRLKKKIPNKVRASSKEFSEIVWINEFFDQKTEGETRYREPYQIVLNLNQSDREACFTYFHEFLHFVSHIYEAELTENQVLSLEKSFPYFFEFFLTLSSKRVYNKSIKKKKSSK